MADVDSESVHRLGWGSQLRSAFQVAAWLPKYERSFLRSDIVAGLTLAAYAIPVAIAYASLAGLPPQAGLYCYLLGGIAYALFGTSKQAAIGPTSAISILIGSALGSLAAGDPSRQAHLAMAVAVLAGLIGIIAWLLRLGNAVNFISETVLSGFKVGAGLVIVSTQLPKLFGLNTGGTNFFTRITDVVRHLGESNPVTVSVGVLALTMLFLGDRLLPSRPIALFVVALSIVAMSVLPLAERGVTAVGLIPQGLPSLGWPVVQWSEVDNLLVLALACFLLSYVESISVVRTFGLKHRYRVDPDQELLALGMANLAAGAGQGYPVAAGMSQSAVSEKAGAKTPMTLIFSSLTIAGVLLYLTALMSNLPQPVLAAVVLFAVSALIKPQELLYLYRVSRFEFEIAMVAMAGVLFFGILKGVLLAAIFSILLMLRRASHPRIARLGYVPAIDRFVDHSRHSEAEDIPHVLVLRVESGIFYFNAQNVMQEVLRRIRRLSGVQLLVIDMSTTPNIDLAGVRMFRELNEELRVVGLSLNLAGVHGAARDLLRAEDPDQQIKGIESRARIGTLISEWEQALRQMAEPKQHFDR